MRGVVAGTGLALALVLAGCDNGAPTADPTPEPSRGMSIFELDVGTGAPRVVTSPPVPCERPTFSVMPGTSAESTLTGVHRRTVTSEGAVSTEDLLNARIVPAIHWLTAAPALSEAAVWAALDPVTRRPSVGLETATATMAGVSSAPAVYLAYAGVRVDVDNLAVTCADGAVLKGTLTSWTDTEAGVITCGAGEPSDRLGRKAWQRYC